MAKKEYIEREEIMRAVDRAMEFTPSEYDAVANEIDRISAADVVEVRHGRWIFEHNPITDPKKYFIRIVCSCCGLKTGQVSNFCPQCGAKMDAERSNQ